MTTACGRITERLGAALDGEARIDARTVEHLTTCAACRSWLRAAERLQSGVLLLRAAPVPAVAAGAVEAWTPARNRRPSGRTLGRALLACAALAQVAVAVALLLVLTGHVVADLAGLQMALGAAFLLGALRPRRSTRRLLVALALVSVAAALLAPAAPAPAAAHWLLEAQHLPALAALLALVLTGERTTARDHLTTPS